MEENAARGENLREDTLIERGTDTVWEMEPGVKVENDWKKWSQHFLTSLSGRLFNGPCVSTLHGGKEPAMWGFKTLEKKTKRNQLFWKRNSPQWNRKRITIPFPVSKNQARHSPCGGPVPDESRTKRSRSFSGSINMLQYSGSREGNCGSGEMSSSRFDIQFIVHTLQSNCAACDKGLLYRDLQ